MGPTPDFFTKSLIRLANLQGRSVLEAVVTGQFETFKGGKIMISAGVGGKSFSYQVPPGMSTVEIMQEAEKALEFWDYAAANNIDINQWLSQRPIDRICGRF